MCSSIQYRRCCGDLHPSVRLLSSVARFPRFSRAPAKVTVCSRSALTPVGSREHTVEEAQKNRRGLEMRGGGGTGWSEWKEAKGGARGAREARGGVHRGCDHRGERFYVRRRRERGNRKAARGGGGGEGGERTFSGERKWEGPPGTRVRSPGRSRSRGRGGEWGVGEGEIFVLSPCPVPARCTFPRRRSEGARTRFRDRKNMILE